MFVGLLELALLRFQLSQLFSKGSIMFTTLPKTQFDKHLLHGCDMNVLVDLLEFLEGLNCGCEL